MNQLATVLKNALGADVAEKITAKSQPVAYFDLFLNNRRRTEINPRTGQPYEDSHIQGRLTLPLARLKQIVAECEAKGFDNAQVYADLWFQHDGSGTGPMLTGHARNVIPDAKRFVPVPRNETTGAPETIEETSTSDAVTP